MNEYIMPVTYLSYVVFGVSLTIWVARTLHIHGKIFLIKGCKGNDELADSLSHLLSVGFYLLHLGIVLLILRMGSHVDDLVSAIELLSTKTGFILLILAISHFIYLAIYTRIHGKPKEDDPAHLASQLRESLGH